jgi:trehalose synthase
MSGIDDTLRADDSHRAEAAAPRLLDRYSRVVGADAIRTLETLARRLRGRSVVMVNTTKTGGGVAEILHRVVVILNELGVPTRWEVMEGDLPFFNVTKKMHNSLHGHGAPLTAEDRDVYRERNRLEARRLALDADFVLIHDPQPAALIDHCRQPGQRWVWRCHIDLSRRAPDHWDFLAPWVAAYDAAIFPAIEFVPPESAHWPSFHRSLSGTATCDSRRPRRSWRGTVSPCGLPS